jgi:hypothetical protein
VESSNVFHECNITAGEIQIDGGKGKREIADYVLVYKDNNFGGGKCQKQVAGSFLCKSDANHKRAPEYFSLKPLLFLVGVRGFEPPTTRPPDVYSNRAELHPELLRIAKVASSSKLCKSLSQVFFLNTILTLSLQSPAPWDRTETPQPASAGEELQ